MTFRTSNNSYLMRIKLVPYSKIKSGYGLNVESELKMLRVIKRIKKHFPIEIKSTFLGAHAIPTEYKNDKQGYIDLIINIMLPEISKQRLADYIDVFCEKGYFSLDDTEQILKAGKEFGLIPKIHVNQFNAFGGISLGIKYKALSVDHLEIVTDEDIEKLGKKHPLRITKRKKAEKNLIFIGDVLLNS